MIFLFSCYEKRESYPVHDLFPVKGPSDAAKQSYTPPTHNPPSSGPAVWSVCTWAIAAHVLTFYDYGWKDYNQDFGCNLIMVMGATDVHDKATKESQRGERLACFSGKPLGRRL